MKYKQVASSSAISDLMEENSKAMIKSNKSVSDAAVKYKQAQQALDEFKEKWNYDNLNLDVLIFGHYRVLTEKQTPLTES